MAPRTVLKEQLMCRHKTDAKKSVTFSDLEKIIDVLINLEDIQKRDTRTLDRSVKILSYQMTRMSAEISLESVSSKIFELEKSVGFEENAEEHVKADRNDIDVGNIELNTAAAVVNQDLIKTENDVIKVANEVAITAGKNLARGVPKLAVLTPGWNSYCPVKPFRGDGNITFASWLRKFQDYIEAGGTEWKDAEKLGKLKLFLDGLPREQFEELTTQEKESFATATRRLVEIIDSPKTKDIARQNLSRCMQEDKESINDFAERLVALVRVATAGQDKLTPHIRFFVKVSSDCTSFEQARLKAQEVEGLPGAATLGAMMQSEEDERTRAIRSIIQEKNGDQMNQHGGFNNGKPKSESNFGQGISLGDNSSQNRAVQIGRFNGPNGNHPTYQDRDWNRPSTNSLEIEAPTVPQNSIKLETNKIKAEAVVKHVNKNKIKPIEWSAYMLILMIFVILFRTKVRMMSAYLPPSLSQEQFRPQSSPSFQNAHSHAGNPWVPKEGDQTGKPR